MRLLDVRSYKVKVFTEKNVPPYAILSHTWDTEEVTLQDIENGRADKLLGFRKIAGCCNQAEMDGFDYIVSRMQCIFPCLLFFALTLSSGSILAA
jgi:hypothetical protein